MLIISEKRSFIKARPAPVQKPSETPSLMPNIHRLLYNYIYILPIPFPILHSAILLQKLLRLIDLRRQIRTSSSIRMVQHHQRTVVLPDSLLRYLPFAVPGSAHYPQLSRDIFSPELQNQRRLSPIHLLLKTPFVKRFPKRSHGLASRPPEREKTCSALFSSAPIPHQD